MGGKPLIGADRGDGKNVPLAPVFDNRMVVRPAVVCPAVHDNPLIGERPHGRITGGVGDLFGTVGRVMTHFGIEEPTL